MEKTNKLSTLKNRFFPSFYQQEAPRLIEFIKYYLEWMQEEDHPYWTIDNLKDFTSIDYTIDKYAEHLKNELMQDFPFEYTGDLKYIMRHLVMLYRSKGTLASYKFFFRAVFNSFCNIFYPRDLILRASDGKWNQGYYMYCKDVPLEGIRDLSGHAVVEVETGLTGLIADVLPHYFAGEQDYKYCFIISDNIRQFSVGNHLSIDGLDGEYQISQAELSEGYWEGTDGFLSSDHVLQDGYYYQQFSYELTTLVPFSEWRDILKKLLHPAGLQMFGRYQVVEDLYPIGCDGDNVKTTFLRWWVIKVLRYVLKDVTRLCDKSWIIKKKPCVYQFPYTADVQYWQKAYGQVESVKGETPDSIEARTNDSNKMVFVDSKLIQCDFANYKFDTTIYSYDVVGVLAQEAVLRLSCLNGVITIPKDRYTTDVPFIFVDGVKVADSRVTKTSTGYTISGKPTGACTIYFIKPNWFTRTVKRTLNTDRITIRGSKKHRLLIFINGEFVWDAIEYDQQTGVLTLPSRTGRLEIYETPSNQDFDVHHYIVVENADNTLYLHLPLKNLVLPNVVSPVELAYYEEFPNQLETYKFSYNADQQMLHKQYGTIDQLETFTPIEIGCLTNESSRLVFIESKLINVDWSRYRIIDDITSTTNYVIVGLRAVYEHIKAECINGTITIAKVYTRTDAYKNAKKMIFVDGVKVLDHQITATEEAFIVPFTFNGMADVYFIDPTLFTDIVTIDNTNGIATDSIILGKNAKKRWMIFRNGYFAWHECKYTQNGKLYLPKQRGYIEMYQLENNPQYRVIEYTPSASDPWTNDKKQLCCFDPLTNIIPSV